MPRPCLSTALHVIAGLLLSAGIAGAEPAEVPVGFEEEPPLPTASPPAAPPTADQFTAAQAAWGDVYRVLTHPRCMNCHPAGDRPLQTDTSRPHRMNISRASVKNGVACSTCHRAVNSEALGIAGGPPGAPHWQLPPEQTPMVFQGHTPASLCAQLKDPARNGGKDLEGLLKHVGHDPLVLWGWQPGGERTVPPLSHADFVKAFTAWVEGGGACPGEKRQVPPPTPAAPESPEPAAP